MNILIVSATDQEVALMKQSLNPEKEGSVGLKSHAYANHVISICISGIGGASTAYHVTKALMNTDFDLAVNVGIAGSFKASIPVGTVVEVNRDRWGDLGAEDGESFLTIEELGLAAADDFPYTNGWLYTSELPWMPQEKKRLKVSAITINTTHGNEQSIHSFKKKFDVDIESMEGAAFLYCCLMQSVPCIQIRGISNMIEQRDKEHWDIDLAIRNLTEQIFQIIDKLPKSEVLKHD